MAVERNEADTKKRRGWGKVRVPTARCGRRGRIVISSSMEDQTEDEHCPEQTEGSELLFPAVRYGPTVLNNNENPSSWADSTMCIGPKTVVETCVVNKERRL
jgi:hypothetical protein